MPPHYGGGNVEQAPWIEALQAKQDKTVDSQETHNVNRDDSLTITYNDEGDTITISVEDVIDCINEVRPDEFI